ncbi:MAG TPA: RidA family protein [Acidimicrobiia bacterium]|jgi:enamine deaminase RidA (YjgF/YER057c/UK114 family)|nr:RidA family protein [Acidimicrobiia bacterium]
MTRHHLFDPDGLPPARGFSYGAIAAEGRTLHIAGITGHREDGSIDPDLVEQYGAACRSVARVITEAGGDPSDLVSMIIYTTDVDGYRANLSPIGERYREVFGRHYPPMALIGVERLFDPAALVELVCVAVVPG